MQLYDLNKDRVSNITTIQDGGVTLIASKLTEEQLSSFGYYNYVTPPQTGQTEYNTLTSSPMVLIDGVYTVTYVYSDIDLIDAYIRKGDEIRAYANQLVTDATSNPVDGLVVDPIDYAKVSNSARNDRADKISGELTLTQAEKDDAKNAQKLSEFEGKIWADAGKATSNMEKLSTTLEVSNFNISAESWNVWIAPNFGV